MGVTWLTHETTYCEKVPSTVKPEYLPLGQTDEDKKLVGDQNERDGGDVTLLETLPAVLAVQAGVGEPLDTNTVTELDG